MAQERRALVVGSSRGLGNALATQLGASYGYTVYGTIRGDSAGATLPFDAVGGVDVSGAGVGDAIIAGLKGYTKEALDLVVISAGLFKKESFEEPSYDDQVAMYKIVAIAPTLIVSALSKAGYLKKGTKIVCVSSEAGSITLRHESEGGGLYGHHAGKAALNMVVRLLSFDLKEQGVTVVALHPGFMRTEMTAGVGFDAYWDSGGAVTPEVAATSLIEYVEKEVDITKTGQFWAPRGPADIGTAPKTLGENLPTPLQLPW